LKHIVMELNKKEQHQRNDSALALGTKPQGSQKAFILTNFLAKLYKAVAQGIEITKMSICITTIVVFGRINVFIFMAFLASATSSRVAKPSFSTHVMIRTYYH
jgi:hypothetical protein